MTASRPVPARRTAERTAAAPATTHPLLRRLFDALTAQGVTWTLARLPSDLAAPAGDVDLLVAPEEAGALRAVAEGLGFVALPGWTSPPSLLLVRYDRDTDRWLALDVATTVRFRAAPRPFPEAARAVLASRRVCDGVALPADAEAFWLLLLHCLLDKQAIAPRHREQLRALEPAAARSAVAQAVLSAAGAPGAEPALRAAVAGGRWEEVAAWRPRLATALARRTPVRTRAAAAASRAAAAARRPLLLPRRLGLAVALVGPNGSGKSTLADGLRRTVPLPSRTVYLGLWPVERRYAGGAVGAAVARPLRLWRDYLVATGHRARGRLVVFDRYPYEAALPSQPPLRAVKGPYHRLLGHAVPPPDLAVVLDAPAAVAHGRKQENTLEELDRERAVYRRVAATRRAAVLVDAARSADAVRADVAELVWERSVRRWRGRTGSVDGGEVAERGRRRGELARACALVPRVLAQAGAALPQSDRGTLIRAARLTTTGTALIALAPPDAPAQALAKLPLSPAAARQLRREGDALAALHGLERLGPWRDLLPRPLAAGRVLAQPYRVDTFAPGRPPLDGIAQPAARGHLLALSAAAIHELHTASAATVAGEAAAGRWVDDCLDDLRQAGAGLHPGFERRAARLRAELHGALAGRTLTVSWIHGDCWLGNVLLSADGDRVEAIVDWDAAAPGELALHDLLHLILFTRRLAGGGELGGIVREQLRRPRLTAQERRLLDHHDGWPPSGLPSYRAALLLYWLRHAALHARQHDGSRGPRYRAWELRNVHGVLSDL